MSGPRPAEFEAWVAFRGADDAEIRWREEALLRWENDLQRRERRLQQREQQFEQREARLKTRQRDLDRRQRDLDRRRLAWQQALERSRRMFQRQRDFVIRQLPLAGPVCQAWMPGSLCGMCQHESCWAVTGPRSRAARAVVTGHARSAA